MPIEWKEYPGDASYDELITPGGNARAAARGAVHYIGSLSDEDLRERRDAAELAMQVMGITFTVYSEGEEGGIDRTWPFDIIPRILSAHEWRRIEAGLRQRVQALNLFIADIYGEKKIVRDHVFPREVLAKSVNHRSQCEGIRPPLDVWAHICGSDLVRDKDGTVYVLEDNLRVPSGVSYMLENCQVMKRSNNCRRLLVYQGDRFLGLASLRTVAYALVDQSVGRNTLANVFVGMALVAAIVVIVILVFLLPDMLDIAQNVTAH